MTGSGRHQRFLVVVRGAHFSPNRAGASPPLSLAFPRVFCHFGHCPPVVGAAAGRALDRHTEPGRSGLVFVGPKGGQLRQNFRKLWLKACADAGTPGVHFGTPPGAGQSGLARQWPG